MLHICLKTKKNRNIVHQLSIKSNAYDHSLCITLNPEKRIFPLERYTPLKMEKFFFYQLPDCK